MRINQCARRDAVVVWEETSITPTPELIDDHVQFFANFLTIQLYYNLDNRLVRLYAMHEEPEDPIGHE